MLNLTIKIFSAFIFLKWSKIANSSCYIYVHAAAKVKLVCNNRDNGTETYTVEGATDSSGTYRLPVAGDHEDDICEVRLVESSRPDCKEPFRSIDSARILLTKNAGVVDKTRYPSALGYMKKEAQPECADVLKEMGFLPLEV